MFRLDAILEMEGRAAASFSEQVRAWSRELPTAHRFSAPGDAVPKPSEGPAGDAEDDGFPVTVVDRVAIVHITGPLVKASTIFGYPVKVFGLSSYLRIGAAITSALNDDSIEAILGRIDSPGGDTSGSVDLADLIYEARGVKPLVAQVTGMAAPAGYKLACQFDQVFAQRADTIGSIGTILPLYDYSRQFENDGIRPVPITAPKGSPFKHAGMYGTEITPEQEADFQKWIDDLFGTFKDVVMRGRAMGEAQFDAVAGGQVWLAPEAVGLGLIDGVQTIEQTLEELQTAARDRADLRARDRSVRDRAVRARAELVSQ